jgi:hypothetical protein
LGSFILGSAVRDPTRRAVEACIPYADYYDHSSARGRVIVRLVGRKADIGSRPYQRLPPTFLASERTLSGPCLPGGDKLLRARMGNINVLQFEQLWWSRNASSGSSGFLAVHR